MQAVLSNLADVLATEDLATEDLNDELQAVGEEEVEADAPSDEEPSEICAAFEDAARSAVVDDEWDLTHLSLAALDETAAAAPQQRQPLRTRLPEHPVVRSMPLDRRPARAPFPRVIHSRWSDQLGQTGVSYLRLSQTYGRNFHDCRAVCGIHQAAGVQCTLTRGLGSHRYVAMLWAWLEAGSRFDSKTAHHSYIPTWEERVSARASLPDQAGIEVFLAAEPQPADESSVKVHPSTIAACRRKSTFTHKRVPNSFQDTFGSVVSPPTLPNKIPKICR